MSAKKQNITKNFSINQYSNCEDSFFDRQERISGWDQEKLFNAKVMVAGAGATGNETLKNLALMGIGNIFIVDFDTVSKSNLSRTILFRKSDTGKKKSEIAANRIKDLALAPNFNVDYFHGDIVWELGTGIFREMDIVLGCLDNVETRFFINRQCWLAETPWIDCGIFELAGHVCVYSPPDLPCYQCNATKEQIIASRVRYSCDSFKRAVINEGKVPTVQTTSALVSAIQVQEAIKILCGHKIPGGKKLFFQGTTNDYDTINLRPNKNCIGHVSYPEIIPIPISSHDTLKNFLEYICQNEFSGSGASLDFSGDRTFVISTACRYCSQKITFYKPAFKILDTDTICQSCKTNNYKNSKNSDSDHVTKKTIAKFNLEDTEQKVLDMRLQEIGIPLMHVVAVIDKNNVYKYYELSDDRPFIFTNIT